MKGVVLAIFFLAIPAVARADILYLENGGRVEGVVSGGPEHLIIRSIHGTMKIAAHRVRHRVELPYITEIFAERRSRTSAKDPDALFALARWCEREGLRKEIVPLLEAVLDLDPDHAPTRARQGLVKYADRWMTPERADELRMTKEGFVRYEDRWFTPAGLKAYIHAKHETARLEEMVARKLEEREARERKIREAEAAKKREEERLRQADEDRLERRRLQRKNDELVDLLRVMHLRDAYYGSWGRRWSVPYYWGWGGSVGWGGCRRPIAAPCRGYSGWVGTGVGTGYRLTGRYTQSPLMIGRSVRR